MKLVFPDGTLAGKVEIIGGDAYLYDREGKLIVVVPDGLPSSTSRDYRWIDRILERGIPDGRKRFILYVASRYLANVRGVDEQEAVRIMREFYTKSGGSIYDAWLRSVYRGVKLRKLLPWSLKKIKENMPDIYKSITSDDEQKAV